MQFLADTESKLCLFPHPESHLHVMNICDVWKVFMAALVDYYYYCRFNSTEQFPNKLNFHPHLHPVTAKFVPVTEFSKYFAVNYFLNGPSALSERTSTCHPLGSTLKRLLSSENVSYQHQKSLAGCRRGISNQKWILTDFNEKMLVKDFLSSLHSRQLI